MLILLKRDSLDDCKVVTAFRFNDEIRLLDLYWNAPQVLSNLFLKQFKVSTMTILSDREFHMVITLWQKNGWCDRSWGKSVVRCKEWPLITASRCIAIYICVSCIYHKNGWYLYIASGRPRCASAISSIVPPIRWSPILGSIQVAFHPTASTALNCPNVFLEVWCPSKDSISESWTDKALQ